MSRKTPLLAYFFVILISFCSFFYSSTSFAQASSNAAAKKAPFEITDFEVVAFFNQGITTAIIEAKDNAGTDRKISGVYPFLINGEKDSLIFKQGFAKLELKSGKVEVINLSYESRDLKINKLTHIKVRGSSLYTSHVPPWTSILPPLIAIFLALIFREVVVSLISGVVVGSFLIWGFSFNPNALFQSITDVFEIYIIEAVNDPGHLAVIIFSLMIGGMVAVVSRNGGMAGVVGKLSRYANNSRNSQFITLLLGVAIFFDDYANTLIVGNTMRPVTDKFKISREKLAYIVDSTAAPVSAIAFVTTWIGAELGYISGATEMLGISESAYSIFLHSLSYSFYPIFTIAFILMLVSMKVDFGPMFRAEKRARSTGVVHELSRIEDETAEEALKKLDPTEGITHYWFNAFIPIVTVIIVTLAGLYITGFRELQLSTDPSDLYLLNTFQANDFWSKWAFILDSNYLPTIIGMADSYSALLWASSMGVLVAILLSLITRTLDIREAVDSVIDGFKTMLPALIILVLAWTLADITKYMRTADYLTSVFSDSLDLKWMPLITFVFSALISFSTGSSWSTMAILYPLLLPLTWTIGKFNDLPVEEIMPVFYNVTATVLAGSVFGDHCSPISDTTVLSSLATNCNHIDHVRTQLPYALTVGIVSMGIGGILVFFNLPSWLNFIIGLSLLFILVRLFGKNPETEDQQGKLES